MDRKIGLFGVPFDPLPSSEAIAIKHGYMRFQASGNVLKPNYMDPYDLFSENLPQAILGKIELLGKVKIPTWIQPKPQPIDVNKINLDILNRFIISGGCLTTANKVRDFIAKKVFPGIPGMIGVDHSSTYGAISALAKDRRENMGLIILDGHFDAVPELLRHRLVEYAQETKLDGIPFDLLSQEGYYINSSSNIRGWTKLNMENFVLHILKHKLIDPKNLVVIGIVDYDQTLEKIDDPRMRDYLSFFKQLEERGTCFVPASVLRKTGAKDTLEKALQNLKTSQVYISLDIDIGALSSVYAARFLNTVGLSLKQIQNIFQSLYSFFSNGVTLAGFDLMEVDIHKLGAKIDSSHVDQTKEIGSLFLDLVGKLVK
jgi:arginase family enzyme